MNFKLGMSRNLRVRDTLVNATPPTTLGHPLSALAVIALMDQPVGNAAVALQAYADLVTAGLPTGTTTLTVAGTPFSGWCLIGPTGLISFQIGRVKHRLAVGANVADRGRKVDTLGGCIQYPGNICYWDPSKLGAGSLYNVDPSTENVSPENDSFVTNQGIWAEVKGVSNVSRWIMGYKNIGVSISSIIETLRPNLGVIGAPEVFWAGRFAGAPIDAFNIMPASWDGAIYESNAQHLTIWDVSVDDNVISQVLSQTGKIYALFCTGTPSVAIQQTLNTSGSALGSVDAEVIYAGATADIIAMDVTNIPGSGTGTGLSLFGSIVDFGGVPYVNGTFDTQLGAGGFSVKEPGLPFFNF